MITVYYDVMLLLSLAMAAIYVFIWHKHFDVHISLIFALVPVANLGFALMARAQSLEEALVCNRLAYIGGCYLLLFTMLSVFSLCHIQLNRWIRAGLVTFTTAVYLSALTMGHSDLFYKSVSFERVNGAVFLQKEYGVMHAVFFGMVLTYFLMSIGAMVYSYLKKKQVSRKVIYLLFMPVAVAMVSFYGGRHIVPQVELIPAAYTFALAVYLVIIWRICLYDITDTAVDTLVQSGDTGLISFDFKYNYLGSNRTARAVFPELNNLTVDETALRSALVADTALAWLKTFREDETQNLQHYEKNDRSYEVRIAYLFDGRRKRGFQMFITDDTREQRYIQLINRFNSELQAEVEEKTEHIVEMHDKLILGMATMVESRDNSTGGHIRRTSEGVRLLVEEMRGDAGLTDEFCRDIVKAAPMHDLGKIAVDDQILRKPGRFTPEEFQQMKAHAAEGARIVHQILEGTDDEDFQRIAENVAHYHHERWDGSGYPDGLKGEEIPLEARIMAVADVYDALVSKRVYKEKMSFEKADAIIMEGMGTQFDRSLEPYYQRIRPKLEAYYSALD